MHGPIAYDVSTCMTEGAPMTTPPTLDGIPVAVRADSVAELPPEVRRIVTAAAAQAGPEATRLLRATHRSPDAELEVTCRPDGAGWTVWLADRWVATVGPEAAE